MIALTYAMGSHMLCPYAVYLKNDLPRYYPDPAIYSDIYDFINRWGKTYLAGYEEAFVVGNGITHPLAAQGQAPLQIEDPADSVYAFVRAKPGKPNDPVVIHLVNWNKDARAHAATETAAQAMRKKDELLGPAQASAYEPLVQETALKTSESGEWVEVTIPALTPWGILVVKPQS
jgi:hypothetical protein